MENLELLTVLSGIRIQVLAQAVACKTAFGRALHEYLEAHLQQICTILERQIATAARFSEDDEDRGDLDSYDPTQHRIDLLDCLEIDTATNEYMIDEGPWRSLDDATPSRNPAPDEQTEGLSRFTNELAEFGIIVTADYVTVEPNDRLAA